VSASVVILGGGLSGMAAALALARAGFGEVCLVERGAELGGLAGTFERDGFFYPLAYHHILHRDRCLHYFLAEIGALERVRWRRVRMLFELGGRFWNLARPNDLLRFPMTARDKLRLATLMARAFTKAEWHDWEGRSARELVERWASPGVANTLFEPLCRLKFGLPAAAVSGAWLGARLNFREGSSSLGYIPGCNWTKVLCDGLGERLADAGVRVLLGAGARRLHGRGALIEALELAGGERLQADAFISTVPPPSYLRMVSADATPGLERIRYTSVVSAICATHQRLAPDFYWLNLLSLEHSACGLFVLSSLNPSIGAPGETCLNFVTHLGGAERALFRLDEDEALKLTTARYYTPSGRSIHKERPRHPDVEGMGEGDEPADAPALEVEPAEKEVDRAQLEKFYTDAGRVVYGGGGIRPDIEIDQDFLGDFEVAVERDGALFSFAVDYAAAHPQMPADFEVTDEVFRQFAAHLKGREKIGEYLEVFKLTYSDSLVNANADFLKRGIRRELARRAHGQESAYRVALEADTQLHHALDLFRKGRTLPELLALAAEWNKAELAKAAAATVAKDAVRN